MNYKLELSEQQLYLIRRALDFYTRVSCGQFEEIPKLESIESYLETKYEKDWGTIGGKKELAESFLNDAKNNLLDLGPHASWGIHNVKVEKEALPMYEIKKTIDHFLWLNRDKTSEFEVYTLGSVDSRPYFAVNIEPLNEQENV